MEALRELREVIQHVRQASENLEAAIKFLIFGTVANFLLSLLVFLKMKDRK